MGYLKESRGDVLGMSIDEFPVETRLEYGATQEVDRAEQLHDIFILQATTRLGNKAVLGGNPAA